MLEIPQYLLDLFGLDAANGSSPFPWDRTYHEETDRRRELRLEGKLMLDELWDLEQLSGTTRYPPRDREELRSIVGNIWHTEELGSYLKDTYIYWLLLDISVGPNGRLKPIRSNTPADLFARMQCMTSTVVERTRAQWAMDHDFYDDAVYVLSQPQHLEWIACEPVIYALSKSTLASTSTLLTRYVRFTQPKLWNTTLRDAYIGALVDVDFPAAWQYVRNWDFQADLLLEIESEEIELEESQRLELTAQERERLLGVLLDRILKPHCRRKPLENLSNAPLDAFEIGIFEAYLLDPMSALPQASFDLMHDLLTAKLLSLGQHSQAIDLDRRVTELVRSANRSITDVQAKRERRQMVNDMVSLLPEVQQELLNAEKDARDEAVADSELSWVTQPSMPIPQPDISVRNLEPPSRRVVSLSGLLMSSSPVKPSANSTASLYQAILQNQANSARSAVSNPPSPANHGLERVSTRQSPRPIQQHHARSPFSSPIRLPRVSTARSEAFAENLRKSYVPPEASSRAISPPQVRPVSEDEDGEATPVPRSRIQASTSKAPPLLRNDTEMVIDEHLDYRTTGSPETEEGEPTPVRPKKGANQKAALGRLQAPRYETRARQVSVAESEPEAVQEMPPSRRAKKVTPQKRSRAQQESTPSATPVPTRARRRTTAQSVEPDTEEVPAPKRTRRTIASTPKESAPPPVKRTARQTRSQSVMSEATTENGDAVALNLRRSGRKASVAPSSPAKSVVSDVGTRTRRAASKQPVETPARGDGVKTRRQTGKR